MTIENWKPTTGGKRVGTFDLYEIVTKYFKSPDGTITPKEVELFTWEKLDFVDKVKAKFNL